RTKIVATIGPASRDPEVLVRMVEAGMDVARLNFSHDTREDHAGTARRVREAAGRAGRQVAIVQDLPGPKLRIGELVGDLAELKPGEVVTGALAGQHARCSANASNVASSGRSAGAQRRLSLTRPWYGRAATRACSMSAKRATAQSSVWVVASGSGGSIVQPWCCSRLRWSR